MSARTTEIGATAHWYVAMSQNHWGRGRLMAYAKRAMTKAGGDPGACIVYRLPLGAEDPQVDDMGNLSWRWSHDAPSRDAQPVEVFRSPGLKERA